MSLSAREQHTLDDIADGLAGSDPALATRLAMFTRLTSGEEMPAREMTGTARKAFAGARRSRPALRSPRAAPLVWLVIVVAMIAAALAVRGGGHACPRTWRAAACASQVSAHYSRPAQHTASLGRATIHLYTVAARLKERHDGRVPAFIHG